MKWKKFSEEKPKEYKSIVFRKENIDIADSPENILYNGHPCIIQEREVEEMSFVPLDGVMSTESVTHFDSERKKTVVLDDSFVWMYTYELFENQE